MSDTASYSCQGLQGDRFGELVVTVGDAPIVTTLNRSFLPLPTFKEDSKRVVIDAAFWEPPSEGGGPTARVI